MKFTPSAVRALILGAQGLHERPGRSASKTDVLATIRRMSALQIDTISVVNRSPYFVLWSRLGHYEPQWLEELLAEGHLFEYWSHEACFLPIEDFALYRHRMLGAEEMGWRYSRAWTAKNRDVMERTLACIRETGPMRAAEFTSGERTGAWWGWKPEKKALEMLFSAGELMIARRHNFQRVYDLRERIHPSWNDHEHLPTVDDARRALILKAVQALGITTGRWIPDYFRMKKKDVQPLLAALAGEGQLVRAQVEGWQEEAYIHPANLPLARRAASGKLQPSLTTLLSPFDPVVWDRNRALAVFNFDYRLECYTPAPKRRYGYFTLPVLHRDALIGRVDAKAHRRDGVFEIKALHFEPGVELHEERLADVAAAIRECAAWHGTPDVRIVGTFPKTARRSLQRFTS